MMLRLVIALVVGAWTMIWTAVRAQQDDLGIDIAAKGDDILSEEFESSLDANNRNYLRRELQTVTCRANNVGTLYNTNDCDETYPCTCTGSSETSCTYCELDTTRGHLCQVTGSSITFVERGTSTMMTCSCEYANGQARQDCYNPMDRTETEPSPTIPIPVSSPPVLTTSVPNPPPPPPLPLPLPTPNPYQSPISSSTCQATNPRNVYVCGGGGGGARDPCENSNASCDGMQYACTCPDFPTVTSCSYCQVRTGNAIMCQVVGSSLTFVSPELQLMTCSCTSSNGVATQSCYHPTPNPVEVPTSDRAPTGSVPSPTQPITISTDPPSPPAPQPVSLPTKTKLSDSRNDLP